MTPPGHIEGKPVTRTSSPTVTPRPTSPAFAALPATSVGPSLTRALAAIDTANEGDPNRIDLTGASTPVALAEGRAAFGWVQRLRGGDAETEDGASDVLLIAARGHHIRRWESPRDEYPRDRAGYQAWRTRLYEVHAGHLVAIMREAGYTAADIDAMTDLIHKRGIKTDADAQTYEDAVALAFLEIQFATFATRTPRPSVVRALKRTWHKMSNRGHEAALTLPLAPDLQALVDEALGGAEQVGR